MKNPGIFLLVLLCCCALTFIGGFFIGRNTNFTDIQVSALPAQTRETTASTAATTPLLIDINTADLAQLQTLPGIGPVLAQRILDYRQENGPFSALSELANVSGIGEKILQGILDHATVGG